MGRTKTEKVRLEGMRELLSNQRYNEYVVTDFLSFPNVWPRIDSQLTAYGQQALDRYKEWAKTAPPQQAVLFGSLSTANTFKMHVERIEGTNKYLNQGGGTAAVKAAECSNFAGHAIGVLLASDKKYYNDYNICLVGIMGGRHNVALLMPKGTPIPESGTPFEQWPPNALIVDPWGVGLGHNPANLLAVSPQNYWFRGSLTTVKVHYQSDNDQTLDRSIVSETKIAETPVNEFKEGKPSRSNPFAAKVLNETKFDERLEQIKEKALEYQAKGQDTAYAAARDLHNKLVLQRDDFINKPFSNSVRSEFANNCRNVIETAKSGELGKKEGFGPIFFNLISTIISTLTFGHIELKSSSKANMEKIGTELNKDMDKQLTKDALAHLRSTDPKTNEEKPEQDNTQTIQSPKP